MKTKPYPPYEERPMVAGEPAVAYQRTDPATYRASHSSKRGYTQEELDELEAESLRPFTWEEARQWIAEAEKNIAAGRVLSHEDVMRKIDELIGSYDD